MPVYKFFKNTADVDIFSPYSELLNMLIVNELKAHNDTMKFSAVFISAMLMNLMFLLLTTWLWH